MPLGSRGDSGSGSGGDNHTCSYSWGEKSRKKKHTNEYDSEGKPTCYYEIEEEKKCNCGDVYSTRSRREPTPC